MGISQCDLIAQNRVPWNFGAKVRLTRAFDQRQICAVAQTAPRWNYRFFGGAGFRDDSDLLLTRLETGFFAL